MSSPRSSLFSRLLHRSAAFLAALLVTIAVAPPAHALTAASLTAANLSGKTLTFTIVQGTAPFETSGNFNITFSSATAYTIPVSDGNAAIRTGTYTVSQSNSITDITFNGYIVNNATVTASIIHTNDSLRSQFEMYSAGPFNKNGVVVFGSGSGSGGGSTAPAITSASTATATVGTAFTYQIAATPAATSYANIGGNAPVSISPTTGLVSGTFTTAGTFTFSFTATNATGTSAITTVTVTVTGSSGGGTTTGDISRYVGRYLGKMGSKVGITVNTALNDYEVLITSTGNVAVNVGAQAAAFTGSIAKDGVVTFTGGTGIGLYNLTTALVEGTTFLSSYGTAIGGAQYRFEFSTSFVPAVAIAVAPAVTSSAALSATVGTAFNYTITATNLPTTYTLTGAPSTLTVNSKTGVITGTPTAAGTFAFAITASNTAGSGSRNVVLTVSPSATTVIASPYNLTGYRNRVGQTFQFTVTGANSGTVWGSDVYTDDSSVAAAAIHAGVLALGETKTVTVTIIAGQGAYSATTRNGIRSFSWGSWSGSYSFAGAGAVGSTGVTTVPTAATGFVALNTTLAVGGRFVCPVTVSGAGPFTYRWYLNGTLITGATTNPYIVETLTSANAGTYAADVTNSVGTTRITAGTVVVNTAGAPVFSLQPFDKVVAPGGTFALAADASGTGNLYQWLRNGVALSGETGSIILRQNVNAADAGTYSVRVTNSAGTVTSGNATVTLNANTAVIANISVRVAAAAGQIITPGFTIAGSGKKRLLVRAVGPGLTQFGLTGVMTDPKLTVFEGSTAIAGLNNDDWATATGAAFGPVGAFPLTAGSKDAALIIELDASAGGRGYTVQVTGNNGSSGIVLLEVYDLGNPTGASKLTNVSVLTNAGLGNSTLILGLYLKGDGQRTLLVRGIGPKLAAFGVGSLLTDPKLQIFDGDQRTVITNNDWSGADFVSELVQASGYVGAFALDNNTTDSATLALLQPNSTYTVQVTGNDGGTGNAIIEVYEVP